MLKKIITAKHRGFCAGVDRAVEIVEKSLIKYGAPVYVRHEIVHNKFVVNNLKEKGVIFVESLDEITTRKQNNLSSSLLMVSLKE